MTYATCPTWAQPGETLLEEQEVSRYHQHQRQQRQQQNERESLPREEQQSPTSYMAVSVPDDDFTKFLDLGDIGLNFPFNDGNTEHMPIATLAKNADANTGIQEELGALEMEMHNVGANMHMQQSFLTPSQQSAIFDNSYQYHRQEPMPDLFTSQLLTSAPPQFPFETLQEEQQMEEQSLRMRYSSLTAQKYSLAKGIPPTPTSFEIQPLYHSYTPQTKVDPTSSASSAHYVNTDSAQFTPLVSPAVTPGDGNVEFATRYSLPGTCFSPLSSPALDAQLNRRSYSQHGHNTDSSAATSPLVLDMDDVTYISRPETETSRKIRKRTSTPRSVNAIAPGKVSPNIRPQRRRGTPKPASSSKETKELRDGGQSPYDPTYHATGMLIASNLDSSDGDSQSLDLLNDKFMAPPPKSSSVDGSPFISGHLWQNDVSQLDIRGKSPATPASLMRLSSDEIESKTKRAKLISKTISPEVQPMEDLVLADAATSSTAHTKIASTGSLTKPITPSISAEKAGTTLPLAISPSASNAMAQTKASPQSPVADGTLKTGDFVTKSSRNLKKQNNTGSKVISPALRPKISPSIKPLLPEGATLSENVHTLLLASKSNYQNILDGTGIPGVHYPEALSKNLSSKRTSHKIAEQGRRNRINSALQEMHSLLPTPPPSQPASASIAALEPPKTLTTTCDENDADTATHIGTDCEKRKLPNDTNADTDRTQQQQQEREKQVTKSASPTTGTSNPPAPASSTSSASTSSAATSLQQNSKAATIESAIEYIKVLKREARERNVLLEKREIKVRELHARLEKAEREGKNGSQPAEEVAESMEISDDRGEETDPAQRGVSVEPPSWDASFDGGDDMVTT